VSPVRFPAPRKQPNLASPLTCCQIRFISMPTPPKVSFRPERADFFSPSALAKGRPAQSRNPGNKFMLITVVPIRLYLSATFFSWNTALILSLLFPSLLVCYI
jgi:hypothetical protein